LPFSRQFDQHQRAPEVEAQARRLQEQEKLIGDLQVDIKRQNVLLEELLIRKQVRKSADFFF
jgi:hypothetical protein